MRVVSLKNLKRKNMAIWIEIRCDGGDVSRKCWNNESFGWRAKTKNEALKEISVMSQSCIEEGWIKIGFKMICPECCKFLD